MAEGSSFERPELSPTDEARRKLQEECEQLWMKVQKVNQPLQQDF